MDEGCRRGTARIRGLKTCQFDPSWIEDPDGHVPEIHRILEQSLQVVTSDEGQFSPEDVSNARFYLQKGLQCQNDAIVEFFMADGRIDTWVSLLDGCKDMHVLLTIVRSFYNFVFPKDVPITKLISEPCMKLLIDIIVQFTPEMIDMEEGAELLKYLTLICGDLARTESFHGQLTSVDFVRGLLSLMGKDNDVDIAIMSCVHAIIHTALLWQYETTKCVPEVVMFVMNAALSMSEKPNILHLTGELSRIFITLLEHLPGQIDLGRLAACLGPWRGRFSDGNSKCILFTLIRKLNEQSDEVFLYDRTTAGMVVDCLTRDKGVAKYAVRFVNQMLSKRSTTQLTGELLFNKDENYDILPILYATAESAPFKVKHEVCGLLTQLLQSFPHLFEHEYQLDSEEEIDFTEETIPASLKLLVEDAEGGSDDIIFIFLATISTIQSWFKERNHDYALRSLFEISGVTELVNCALTEGPNHTAELARWILETLANEDSTLSVTS